MSQFLASRTGEGVRGGSPARPRPAASASPMPRLLLSAAGLSGSASRLSGGAAGAGLSTTRLAASYSALGSSASSGYGSCAGVALASSTRHEDSEDLSDVSSGAASEDSARRRRRRSAQSMKGEASVSGNEDFEWVRGSPMLTGLREGQVTRLATPPDHRTHSLRSSLATPTEAVEEACAALTPRHRQYPRPPPVPRPRTLEAGELVPHRSIRDLLRDSIRDSRDNLRDRLYSPSRELTGHRLSRDSSVERSGRDSSCDRASVSSLHQHSHHHHHHLTPSRLSQHPCCDPPSCWCEEEELDYESCDERHHHHRHSYHEGLHRAHLHQLQPHHHHRRRGSRESSREHRSRGQGTADSGRSSPCCCRHCLQSGSHSSLATHDYCTNNRLALPCTNKVGGGLVIPQGSRQHRRLDSDYIALWSCHSPPVQRPVSPGRRDWGGSLEDRVIRLEGDKDSLQLQVTVLSEQVEAQAEKITDLENLLDDKKEQLQKAEEQLQKEMMIRTSLETQRLELVSEISNLKLHQAAYERENSELRDKLRHSDHHSDHSKVQPVPSGASLGRYGSGRGAAPAAASTPVHSFIVTPDSPQANHQLAAPLTNSPSPSSISTLSTIPASSPNKSPAPPATASPASSPVASHDAREFLSPRTPPPNARRKIDQFGTVPRQREPGVGGENSQTTTNAGRTKGVMFAETEMQMIEDLPEGEYEHHDDGASPASSSPRSNTLAGHRSPPTHPKATGIKKIFTKLRRSSSGHLDGELGEGDFRRGGMRATASARLGWTSPSPSFKEPSESFDKWSFEMLEKWLGVLGLSQYSSPLRSWTLSGHHLSRATPQNLERELGIRHPLHRKKLQLAISARMSGDQLNTPLHRLDHSWVLRWLDDVGLPQYKDAFSEARIDGRVLNCLTYDDLSFLRLSNLLHVTSLKRGIQVLREHNFDPSVLKRRSVPDEDPRARTSSQVALWTNHRVMEWLRTVDLSEYAPNLRGSGVHGALMVYEVRFTSELLASLLSIPSGKTLLRRHLNTHFKELVGRSVVQEKRELEASSGYTPLTTSAKVKMPKKSQFSLKRKKSKSDLEFDDLLCPLDEKPPLGALQDREKEHPQQSSAPSTVGRITKV
ncbi:liprin-beta-1-like isoform X5 [Eriocheir sinensis]|uniref:liprin-beta-1-like isoform X5 n=1 Tax=Eriocheir sinensis TaxID=95602 RepID=UPI0021C59C21|nr:liprin-beta-1-like isoform X5 [Eriocheir sinensis]